MNRNSRVPLYAQLEADLRGRINEGALKPGDMIPSETELGRSFGVSRITVRAALHSLEHDGLLERQMGRGTFVKASTVEAWSCLTSFTEQMLRAGRNPTTKLLALRTLRGDPEIARLFRTKDSEPFVFIERLRCVDGEPAALMRAYIPRRLVPGIGRKHFRLSGREQSILFILDRHFGLGINEGEETTAPVCLTPPESELLGLKEGSPVVYKSCLVQTALASRSSSSGPTGACRRPTWCVGWARPLPDERPREPEEREPEEREPEERLWRTPGSRSATSERTCRATSQWNTTCSAAPSRAWRVSRPRWTSTSTRCASRWSPPRTPEGPAGRWTARA